MTLINSHNGRPQKIPSQAMQDWLALNPYQLREQGLHEKLSLEEFGRIFYQIAAIADIVLGKKFKVNRKCFKQGQSRRKKDRIFTNP